MVLQAITVKDTYWDTQVSPNLSYTVPKTVKLGSRRYNIVYTNIDSIKRK